MFCPVCKSEYRLGFTKCSDCGVDLVECLPETISPGTSDLVVAWRGTDPSAFSAALAALEDAAVPSCQISDHDQLVSGLAVPRPQYKILVRKSDLAVAFKSVAPFGERAAWAHARDIWKGRTEMREVEARDSGESSDGFESADAADDIATEFNPKEATSEVWSGDDAELAETFKACLREVGIHCVITADNGKERVLVLPAAEARAKEIIREIVEQAPPE